ncbi:tetratricopeptide repeat protein [Prochlorococcus sp. MIT 0604]|uniref:tetratricopeptide repeat protein n=1 Tax=Prochlorococcus sp. MIT 0604 TaxID=1501268 RepID=UPI0004F664FF|nr:tetratricopeptide repeat protein [Prochlorococcus sp. MIT 0604]AIQ95745.1 TPR domain protein [Prochlorococcus sp. MIT 0604]
MEERYPDKCSRCGAPIEWEEGASFSKCGFCGKKNFAEKGVLNKYLDFSTFRNPKKIIENPTRLLIILPITFIFLFMVSTFKKQTIIIENKINPDQILSLFDKETDTKKEKENLEAEQIKTSSQKEEEKKELLDMDQGSPEAAQEYIERLREIFLIPGKEQETIKLANIALNLHKNSARAFNYRAVAKSKLKDYQAAIDDFNMASEIDPSSPEIYFNRGLTKHKIKDYVGAIIDFTKAIEIKPDYASAYNNRGSSKYLLNDYTRSIIDFTKAIEIKPDYASAYKNRASSKIKIDDRIGALNDLTKAIKIKPDFEGAYAIRGLTKHQLEDYKGAINDYTKAIKIRPADLLYKYRGISKFKLLDKKGACSDFRNVSELNNKYWENWFIDQCNIK